MENIKMSVANGKLVIEVDLKKEIGMSKSGKNMLIATTGGNAEIPNGQGAKIGLNIYRPKD